MAARKKKGPAPMGSRPIKADVFEVGVDASGRQVGPTYTARHVPVKTRALVTVGVATAIDSKRIEGAIVRVRMLPGDEPDSGALVAVFMREHGAAAVKVVPCPVTPGVVVPDVAPGAPAPVRLSARAVVEAMVADAVGVEKDELATLVGRVLDEEGL